MHTAQIRQKVRKPRKGWGSPAEPGQVFGVEHSVDGLSDTQASVKTPPVECSNHPVIVLEGIIRVRHNIPAGPGFEPQDNNREQRGLVPPEGQVEIGVPLCKEGQLPERGGAVRAADQSVRA